MYETAISLVSISSDQNISLVLISVVVKLIKSDIVEWHDIFINLTTTDISATNFTDN